MPGRTIIVDLWVPAAPAVSASRTDGAGGSPSLPDRQMVPTADNEGDDRRLGRPSPAPLTLLCKVLATGAPVTRTCRPLESWWLAKPDGGISVQAGAFRTASPGDPVPPVCRPRRPVAASGTVVSRVHRPRRLWRGVMANSLFSYTKRQGSDGESLSLNVLRGFEPQAIHVGVTFDRQPMVVGGPSDFIVIMPQLLRDPRDRRSFADEDAGIGVAKTIHR